ncbi:hypothetical protein ACFSUK_12435 [Sphingobium scionense]
MAFWRRRGAARSTGDCRSWQLERAGTVALLYQALPPPTIDGLRKDAKPGGYSDGGADIGFALKGLGRTVVTPMPAPDPAQAMHWVFPDTADGIAAAIAAAPTRSGPIPCCSRDIRSRP